MPSSDNAMKKNKAGDIFFRGMIRWYLTPTSDDLEAFFCLIQTSYNSLW